MGGSRKMPALSKRLRALCHMVTSGMRVVDVGCDHGLADIYLVQQGISPGVLAMDVREGPLSRAREHVAAYGLGDYITTRLSDGLEGYRAGEAQALICAGMGGRLMQRILAEGGRKVEDLEELILQPQSELPEFRRFLRSGGYTVLQEKVLEEGGKYYFLIKASRSHRVGAVWGDRREEMFAGLCSRLGEGKCGAGGCLTAREAAGELCDRFGMQLLWERDRVLYSYLEAGLGKRLDIAGELLGQQGSRAKERMEEIQGEAEWYRLALEVLGIPFN